MKRASWLKKSNVASPWENQGFLLWHRFHDWQRTINAVLRPYDLTQLQFSTLAVTGWLGRNGDTVTQQDISDFARLDRMLVSQVVRKLEKKGLVERMRRSNDRRAVCVSLTDAGEKALAKSLPVVQAADAEFFSSK
jgi:DNA-binding MarR family transcriptional regulator